MERERSYREKLPARITNAEKHHPGRGEPGKTCQIMTLFGVDISNIVSSALEGQLRPVTVTRTSEGTYDPVTDEVTGSSSAEYTSEGIEENRRKYLESGLIESHEVPVLILAQPLETEPRADDKLEIDGNMYTVVDLIERDPAGAIYIVRCRR